MPTRCLPAHELARRLAAVDWVVSRTQALAWGLTRDAVRHRTRYGAWRVLLPGVYLAHPGEPYRRQRLRAALLWAGLDAVVEGPDACRYYGLSVTVDDDDPVYVAVGQPSTRRSIPGVVVRRSNATIAARCSDVIRWAPPAVAVVSMTRRIRSRRRVLALASEAVQRRIVGYDELLVAHLQGPPRRAAALDEALAHLCEGLQSVAEVDFRLLVRASTVLPPPSYNAWLTLPGGRSICADALWAEAALIHEVNGRGAHARADLFDDMQSRHDELTAAGFTVLHNSPRTLGKRPRLVLEQVEACYRREAGRGLPAGVRRASGYELPTSPTIARNRS